MPLARYRRLRGLAVVFLALEFVVGMGGYLTARHEIFPFASWFLFPLVPNQPSEYDLILSERDGHPIQPPVPFSQAAGYVLDPHSIVSFQVIQQLGGAEEARDAQRSRSARQQIAGLLGHARVRYDLVRVTYDPVERWETGRVLHREKLRTFTTGEP